MQSQRAAYICTNAGGAPAVYLLNRPHSFYLLVSLINELVIAFEPSLFYISYPQRNLYIYIYILYSAPQDFVEYITDVKISGVAHLTIFVNAAARFELFVFFFPPLCIHKLYSESFTAYDKRRNYFPNRITEANNNKTNYIIILSFSFFFFKRFVCKV